VTDDRRHRVNAPHVVFETFEDGEATIINLKTGSYFSLDPVGAAMWKEIEAGRTVDEVARSAARRYEGRPAEIAEGVSGLVSSLVAHGLIAPADPAAPAPGPAPADEPPPGARPPFVAPVLEAFNNLQDLLLLDPIHEVADAGWPEVRKDAGGR